MLKLAFGLRFADLYSVEGALAIDQRFGAHLRAVDASLAERLAAARAAPDTLPRKDEAALLIDVAPHVEDFPAQSTIANGVAALRLADDHSLRRREGFALTDAGTSFEGSLSEAHYCIWCHEQGKDSCARGLPEKKPADGAPLDNPFKKSAFGVTLAGCPLEERISEFHKLRAEGWPIGALAVICIDNRTARATAAGFSNAARKACI